MLLNIFITLSAIALSFTTTARTIKVPIIDKRLTFATDLVSKLILSDSHYTITQPYKHFKEVEHSRVLNDMRNKKIDLFLSMTNKEYEEEFQAIYIPVYRGLLGMRIPIIKRSNTDLLKDVKNLHDLKSFKAGQGRHWSDTKILQHNNLPTISEIKYSNLFNMLHAGRFDYFPRGIHEAWSEVEDRPTLGLAVDQHILLWYPAPMYIFVRKNDKKLVQHLNQRFEKIIKNGEFNNMFYNDINIQTALKKGNLKKRTIIKLDVPFTSEFTPTHRPELWVSTAENINPIFIAESP